MSAKTPTPITTQSAWRQASLGVEPVDHGHADRREQRGIGSRYGSAYGTVKRATMCATR